MNAVDLFKQAIQKTGIEPPAEILADGILHRFTVPGDKARSDNGFYTLHPDGIPAGQFGCWKRGISGTWSSKEYKTLTPEEKARYTAKMEAMKRQRDEERERIQAECRAWCADTWEKAKDATNESPYLKRKGVPSYGLKAFGDTLMVPLMDMAEVIHGIQFISADGSKKFKTGTNKAGHFYKIGKFKNKTVLVCEGYATGASLHQATGHCVVIAFDAGNLKAVTAAIRAKYSGYTIIIAADDDHATEGNPGMTKAREAAESVNGKLAVPVFQDAATRGTDFNDLHQVEGLGAVKACIEAAAMPEPAPATENPPEPNQGSEQNTLDATITKLAALSPLQYDLVRKAESKTLGVRPGTLDAAVKNARKGSGSDDLPFTEVDPWAEPVDPAKLLTDIAATIRRFIVCNEEISHAVALWVAMTWFIDVVQVAPLAVITAPEKRCGKTQLLYLLGRLSARAITASSISPAALFRTIDAWNPTLLIDEADAFMRDNEELRGLLNSGHTRDSAYVIRTVGENFVPTKFSTWGAKALAGIGHVADTLMDRAVILELRRKLAHETVERIRHAGTGLFDDLRAKLARFADDYSEKVRQARPPLPESLNDRAQDNWEPLLAIAMVASDEWLKIGTTAALKLSGGESASQTIGTELLSDIQEIFEQKQVARISTAELIRALCADDEKPWATYNRGLPIKPRQLAKKLRGYDILSKSIRIGGETPKGYEKEQFTDAFFRYITPPPENIRNTPQTATSADPTVADNPTRCGYETEKATRRTATSAGCGVVADRNPLPEENIFSDVAELENFDVDAEVINAS